MGDPSRVVSIHRVPEHKLSRRNLLALMEDGDGLKAGERLEEAEDAMRRAIRRYLKAGGSPEIIRRCAEAAISQG